MQRQRVPHRLRVGLTAAAAALAAASPLVLLRDGGAAAPISFREDVQPIFDRKCTSCHPVAYPYLDLRAGRSYRQLVRVSATTAPAFERVLPGRPELSYLLTHPPDPSLEGLLSERERELIAAWIRAGARDD